MNFFTGANELHLREMFSCSKWLYELFCMQLECSCPGGGGFGGGWLGHGSDAKIVGEDRVCPGLCQLMFVCVLLHICRCSEVRFGGRNLVHLQLLYRIITLHIIIVWST